MLEHGRILLNSAEHDAVEVLITKNNGDSISFTRSEPGETGSVLVHVDDKIYLIDEDGTTRKAS